MLTILVSDDSSLNLPPQLSATNVNVAVLPTSKFCLVTDNEKLAALLVIGNVHIHIMTIAIIAILFFIFDIFSFLS